MRLPEGLVSPLNIPGWRDFPLVARLEADYGVPVALDNDAKAFALGEHLLGAGRGHPDMMGVVVSTGVGGGLISGGALLHGRTFNAGHVGHVVAEPDGPPCVCGGRGCVEAIASGPSIARLVRAELERGRESVLSSIPAGALTARDVARAASLGDALAKEGMERAGRALGIGFAGAAALLDIDLIVVGGGVTGAGELLMRPLRRTLEEHARLEYIRGQVEVIRSADPQNAGIIGAAALALQEGGLS
jgi:glucokinase